MSLQHLTDVHPAGHTQRVQHNVHRRAIGQLRHVLFGKDDRDDALVAVAAGHLVPDGDFALLSHIHPHQGVDTGRELVALVAAEHLHRDDLALLAVGHLQGRIAHLARLLPEDGPQQPLFRGQLSLALGRDLAHQNVPGAHLGADAHDSALIQVPQRFLPDVGDVAGDLFRPELGITRLDLVLLDVHGGEQILAHETLRDDDRVFVVVALPGHEGHQHVAAQGQFALVRAGPIRDDVPGLHHVAGLHDRLLVDARPLVAALELDQLVGLTALVSLDDHLVPADRLHLAVAAGDHDRPRVHRSAVLHPGPHQRRLAGQQGHRLALHVGPHQRPVGVVVLQERDQRRGHGDGLLGRHVHEIDLVRRDEHDLSAVAGRHAGLHQPASLVDLGVGLRNDVVVLFVGRQVADLPGDSAVPHLAIGGLDESQIVDPGVRGQ